MSTVETQSVESDPGRLVPRAAMRINELDNWGRSAALLLVTTGLLLGIRRAEAPYADGDVLWAARAGRDFLSTGHIPHTDSYSWTLNGHSWIPNSWGWNVVLGIADKLGGLSGIAVLGALMTAAIALVAGATAKRDGASPAWTALTLQVVAGVFALFMYPRAQIVDYLAIFVLPALLVRVVTGDRREAFGFAVALAATQVVWMNLHSAALIGPVIVAAAGIGHALRAPASRRSVVVRRIIVCLAATAAATLATPYGFASIDHATEVRSASAGLISEWRPVGIGSPEQLLGLAGLLIGAFACWLAIRAKRYDSAAILVVLGIATVSAIRFTPMVALFAVPELATAAGRIRVRAVFVNRIAILALGILAIACLAGMRGFAEPGIEYSSPSLVAKLATDCKLLNDSSIGGDVIHSRPDVPVSIDSRNDMYGRHRELESLRQMTMPMTGLAFVRSNDITCVLGPTQAPLVVTLRHDPRWQVVGTDSVRTLLVRRSAA